MRKEWIIRIWKLNKNQTREKFEKRVNEIVSTDVPSLWKTFKNSVLKARDKVRGKKKEKSKRQVVVE